MTIYLDEELLKKVKWHHPNIIVWKIGRDQDIHSVNIYTTGVDVFDGRTIALLTILPKHRISFK
jgi:hypothetical protein